MYVRYAYSSFHYVCNLLRSHYYGIMWIKGHGLDPARLDPSRLAGRPDPCPSLGAIVKLEDSVKLLSILSYSIISTSWFLASTYNTYDAWRSTTNVLIKVAQSQLSTATTSNKCQQQQQHHYSNSHTKWHIFIQPSCYTLCSEKNTHSHFLSYLHELFVNLNKNCSEYTQGLIDSNNVKISYSVRSLT